MRYIGSKTSTLPWLSKLIEERAPDARSLCDPFAGTCTVARHFKAAGLKVFTGDVLEFSRAIQIATLEWDAPPLFAALAEAGVIRRNLPCPAAAVFDYLQNLPLQPGFIHASFSPASADARLFFTEENAARIDTIRAVIERWEEQKLTSANESAYLVAALIYAADRVANTAGTYYAYLKTLTRKARQPLRLCLPPTTAFGSGHSYRGDARKLISTITADVLYLDPPYNTRDYSRYYHLPETIALNRKPAVHGKSGQPNDLGEKSDFYRQRQAAAALEEICTNASANYIAVHYTSAGAIEHEMILQMLGNRGVVRVDEFEVRAYSSRAGTSPKSARHRLYWCDVKKAA